jgi:hypothetical protein
MAVLSEELGDAVAALARASRAFDAEHMQLTSDVAEGEDSGHGYILPLLIWVRNNKTLCELPHTDPSKIVHTLPLGGFTMRKHISFTIAAAILGSAMGLWLKDSRVETNANVARADLSSPMSKPYRAIPVFDLVH